MIDLICCIPNNPPTQPHLYAYSTSFFIDTTDWTPLAHSLLSFLIHNDAFPPFCLFAIRSLSPRFASGLGHLSIRSIHTSPRVIQSRIPDLRDPSRNLALSSIIIFCLLSLPFLPLSLALLLLLDTCIFSPWISFSFFRM